MDSIDTESPSILLGAGRKMGEVLEGAGLVKGRLIALRRLGERAAGPGAVAMALEKACKDETAGQRR